MRPGIRQPRGLRYAARRAALGKLRLERDPALVLKSTREQAVMCLSAMPLEHLLRVWAKFGGGAREFEDGTLQLLAVNGEPVSRGDPADIEGELRARLERMDPMRLIA